jgi:hypothetical protein
VRAAFVVVHAAAKDAIATYSGQERDQVLAAARGALNRPDTEIELREIWSGCPRLRA